MKGIRFVYSLLLCTLLTVSGARAESLCVEHVPDMREQAPELWQRYQSGWQMSVAGDVLMPVGVVTALAAGVPLLLWGDWQKEGLSNLGRGLMCLGAAAVVVSIPLVVVGNQRSVDAYEEFVFDCVPLDTMDIGDTKRSATQGETPAVALHLQTSANGIGLSLHF